MSVLSVSVLVCWGGWTQGVDTVFLRQIRLTRAEGRLPPRFMPSPLAPPRGPASRAVRTAPKDSDLMLLPSSGVGGCLSCT